VKNNHIITSALIILFLVKPTIDLTWSFRVNIGMSISPLHIAGVLVLIYFGIQYIKYWHITAPYSIIFTIFIIVNIISIIIGIFFYGFNLMAIMDIMIRILASYLIYNVAFIAGTIDRNINYYKLIKAIMIGSSIAVLINFIGIKLGYGGVKEGALDALNGLRERGLYYESGTMSNVAMFHIIFSVLFLHMLEKNIKKLHIFFWYIFSFTTIAICLYVIYLGLSRSVMLQLAIFTFFYILLVQKVAGKIVLPSLIAIVLLGGVIQGDTYDRLLSRFQGDIEVFEESDENDDVEEKEGVSLGKYEQLGNNRGKNWAEALTSIIDRTVIEIILGNFKTTEAHSDYVDVLSRNGIIGLIIYLFLLFALFFKTLELTLIRSGEQHEIIHVWAWILIAFYIAYSLPFRPLIYTTTVWYMWAMLGFSMALAEGGSKSSSCINGYSTKINNILSKRKIILRISHLSKGQPLLIRRRLPNG
jgi:hypothetical protein